MVLKLDGNSEIGGHVCTEIGYLITLMQLLRSIQIENFISKKGPFFYLLNTYTTSLTLILCRFHVVVKFPIFCNIYIDDLPLVK